MSALCKPKVKKRSTYAFIADSQLSDRQFSIMYSTNRDAAELQLERNSYAYIDNIRLVKMPISFNISEFAHTLKAIL